MALELLIISFKGMGTKVVANASLNRKINRKNRILMHTSPSIYRHLGESS